MKYQNILQSFLCNTVNVVNLKMEAVSSESFFKKNKHWICRINLVFIHRSNNNYYYNNNNNNNNNNINNNNNSINNNNNNKIFI